jgi:GT2 family glycosyltransferase
VCSELKVDLKKEDKPRGLTNLWNRAYADFWSSSFKNILITNNDVIFPTGSIEEMVRVFNEQSPVILGPVTNKPGTGINQRVGNYLCNVNLDVNDPINVQILQDMLISSMTNKFIPTNYINGFCFMVGRDVNKYRFNAICLFPPQKINIGNEDWLCNQVRKMSGHTPGAKFVICLTSFVFHYKALTTRWCKLREGKKRRESLWREV